MEKVLVEGLEGQGPGDIVGAFVSQAGISPDDIGEIDVRSGTATVEVAPDVRSTVVDRMDGALVGPVEVTVRAADEELVDRRERVHDYVDRYERLVEMEREEEMRRHEEAIRSLSGREREAKGRAMLDMKGVDEGQALSGYEVKFLKARRDEPLPETEIAHGDLVMASRDDPLRDDNPTGTVTKKTTWTIHVVFDDPPPDFLLSDGVRLDLYVNDVTYQRMLSALDELARAHGRLAELRDTLIGLRQPESSEASVDAWHDAQLNDSQRRAVQRSLEARDVHLVHGPPGTGKTTTVIEVVRQAVDRGRSVLATAASNTAVDNLLEFLVDRGVDAVRVGHPARVTPKLREHTLDARVEAKQAYQEARQARQRALELKDEQDQHTHPSGRWRRGMSNDRIKGLAQQGRGSRGVPPDKIESMARWLELDEEIDELFENHDRLEQQAIREVLEAADVVCTTNSTAGSRVLEDDTFDVLVLDEATQATEPSALIPLTKADKVVMAGDHRQLPPTVVNEQAAREGLRQSLFERVAETHDSVRTLLDTQYRMHETIMRFSDEQFYDDRLEAADAVREHTLADLGFDPDPIPGEAAEILDPKAPVTFVDTADLDAPERTPPGSPSKENPLEAEIVADLARAALAGGLVPDDVAVITPYDAQKDRINGDLDVEGLEVDTVDGFQGREKELVLISLVRANDRGHIGFLEDLRRLNVALTRAKRKLVVVGDSTTVGQHETYRAFVEHTRDAGRVVDAV